MKEIGSFIELELPRNREYYSGDSRIARLNTGRSAIWHAFRLTGATALWIPYYQCESVRDFLLRRGCSVRFYHQDESFTPVDLDPEADEAVLLVNYFGVMSYGRMAELAGRFRHVIVDNCQAFFCPPVPGTYSVYSTRKFFGVADGAYVIGEGAEAFVDDYPQGYSSDTASFLLTRIEYGCEGKGYSDRTVNELRLDGEDVLKMSRLTHAILDGTDYHHVREKRKENFAIAAELFGRTNRIDALRYADNEIVPMVYPLVIEDDNLLDRLISAKHFQGRWWNYLTRELPDDTFEHWLSRYLIPVTIDQRYGREELSFIHKIVLDGCL